MSDSGESDFRKFEFACASCPHSLIGVSSKNVNWLYTDKKIKFQRNIW